MELLTENNVNPYNYTSYDYKAYSKGRAYYYQKRVSLESFDSYSATCLVEGVRVNSRPNCVSATDRTRQMQTQKPMR